MQFFCRHKNTSVVKNVFKVAFLAVKPTSLQNVHINVHMHKIYLFIAWCKKKRDKNRQKTNTDKNQQFKTLKNNVIILIECKSVGYPMKKKQLAKLYGTFDIGRQIDINKVKETKG